MTLPHWTKQDVFPSLSPTTQPFVPYRPLFANMYTFTSLFHAPVAITSLKLHPLSSLQTQQQPQRFCSQGQTSQSHITQPARGSYSRGKNCLTCKYISDGKTSYTFHSAGETRPITHHIDCRLKKRHLQDTMQLLLNTQVKPDDDSKTVSTNTADYLTTHLSDISKPTTVSEHFLTNDHSANDITLIPLKSSNLNRDSERKAREAYLIERGITLELLGQYER